MKDISQLTEAGKELESKLKESFDTYESLISASDQRAPADITLNDFIKDEFNYAPNDDGTLSDSFLDALGIDPSQDSFNSLLTTGSTDGRRWLVPEIIADIVRVGMVDGPIYPDFIAAEQNIRSNQITMPTIDMSKAYPKTIEEGEDIPVAEVAFKDRKVNLKKRAVGLSVVDEVMMYSSINLVGLFLEEVGQLLGAKVDAVMVDTLLNGDQADGSLAAPVIGVENTANGITYPDILDVWISMGLLRRTPNNILSGKDGLKDILLLPEFKDKQDGMPQRTLNMRSSIPSVQNGYVHGVMPSNYTMFVNKARSIVKLNGSGVMVDRDRIAKKQIEEAYISQVVGYGIINKDARVVLQNDALIGDKPYPDYMQVEKLHKLLAD